MSLVNRPCPAGQEAKADSVTRWRPRRVAYLGIAVLFITVAGYAVKDMQPEANAAPSLPFVMKLVDHNGYAVSCTVSISMERAEDFDPNNPKFKLRITDSNCSGGGVDSATGTGSLTFPNNGSCAQITGAWTGTIRWKNSSGGTIGTSDVDGSATLVSTGAGGTTSITFLGTVTGTFDGSTITSEQASAGTGLTCVVVGDIGGGDLTGAGAVAP